MFQMEFSETLAFLADASNVYLKKGGFYSGTITAATLKENSIDDGVTLILELETEDKEKTGKQFFVLRTKDGSTTDKNGRELSGRCIIQALQGLLKIRVLLKMDDLIGKDISFFGEMKRSENQDGKEFLNFTIRHFMSPKTGQTYTEMKKDEPAECCLKTPKDEILTEVKGGYPYNPEFPPTRAEKKVVKEDENDDFPF